MSQVPSLLRGWYSSLSNKALKWSPIRLNNAPMPSDTLLLKPLNKIVKGQKMMRITATSKSIRIANIRYETLIIYQSTLKIINNTSIIYCLYCQMPTLYWIFGFTPITSSYYIQIFLYRISPYRSFPLLWLFHL